MALVRCNTGFVRGAESVHEGDIFDDSHELVRKTPTEWWSPLHVRGQVEEATAAPGKKRAVKIKADTAVTAKTDTDS
jgi:hypothetical protein